MLIGLQHGCLQEIGLVLNLAYEKFSETHCSSKLGPTVYVLYIYTVYICICKWPMKNIVK